MKILALKNEPKSCSECKLCETTELVLDYYNESHRCLFNPDICIKERYEDRDNEVEFSPNDFDFRSQLHPQCSLISIDIDELEETYRLLQDIEFDKTIDINVRNTICYTNIELKSIIEKLKGRKTK